MTNKTEYGYIDARGGKRAKKNFFGFLNENSKPISKYISNNFRKLKKFVWTKYVRVVFESY